MDSAPHVRRSKVGRLFSGEGNEFEGSLDGLAFEQPRQLHQPRRTTRVVIGAGIRAEFTEGIVVGADDERVLASRAQAADDIDIGGSSDSELLQAHPRACLREDPLEVRSGPLQILGVLQIPWCHSLG